MAEDIAGRYRIMGIIGKGGMSRVYKAYDTHLGIETALKEIPVQYQKYSLSELEVLKNCNHWGLPRIWDYFEEKGYLYIVMEYIKGITLKEHIRRKGILPEEEVRRIAVSLCEVLEYLHKRKIVYGDMKPENIMIRENETVTLIDFGTAMVTEAGQNIAGTAVTLGYGAPEQIAGGPVTLLSDIYSLGLTIYTMYTGHNLCTPPYKIKKYSCVKKRISRRKYRIIRKCTSRKLFCRYKSVSALRRALNSRFCGRKLLISVAVSIFIIAGIYAGSLEVQIIKCMYGSYDVHNYTEVYSRISEDGIISQWEKELFMGLVYLRKESMEEAKIQNILWEIGENCE